MLRTISNCQTKNDSTTPYLPSWTPVELSQSSFDEGSHQLPDVTSFDTDLCPGPVPPTRLVPSEAPYPQWSLYVPHFTLPFCSKDISFLRSYPR